MAETLATSLAPELPGDLPAELLDEELPLATEVEGAGVFWWKVSRKMNELNEFLQPAARVRGPNKLDVRSMSNSSRFARLAKKQWGRWDFEMNNNDMMIRARYRESTHDSPGISWGEIGNCWSLLVPYVSIHQWQAGKKQWNAMNKIIFLWKTEDVINHRPFIFWYVIYCDIIL